jgi:hypothetical protein
MHTVCGTVLRTSSTTIRNYVDSDGDWNWWKSQRKKLHSHILGLVTGVMYRVTGLTWSFVYGMDLQPACITYNNLAGDAHHLPPNQPTITNVDLCHKKFGRPRFTETRAIKYQPSVSVHNAPFHPQCHTTHKRTNKTCQNNITLPTNIQYLKIHVRN